MLFGGKGRGEGQPVSMQELSTQERAERIQKQMQEYLDLVQKRAPAERIKKAESELSKEIGKDRFEAFKRHLPQHMRARRDVDARRTYRQFRLPGRHRVIHDRRGKAGGKRLAGREARKAAERMRLREGKLVREKGRRYPNFLDIDARMRALAATQKPEVKAKLDELLSKFEKLIVDRFEKDAQLAKSSKEGKTTFLKKTEAQWKSFFASFAGRILKKKVPTQNVREFLFRGLIQRGGKGLVISDMTLASGRVERFIRFSILADAMAKLARFLPGEKFGKEMLTTEELYYLALASARGKEYATAPRPTPGRFMGGVAEERAARALGLPVSAHTEEKGKTAKKGMKGLGGFGGFGKEKEPYEELPYQFVPWWHWGNLKRPGKFKMVTVAFYIALGLVTLLGILAITQKLLK